MATCVEVAGTEYPSSYEDNAVAFMEGVGLAPEAVGLTAGEIQGVLA